jgi:GTP1/Obg family GTP-binding protein
LANKEKEKAMDPNRVEQLANRIREHRESTVNVSNAIGHLEAAHAKLMQLQAGRRELKAELERCVEERDNALREVDRLNDEQKSKAVVVYEVQDAIITRLKREHALVVEALKEILATLTADAGGRGGDAAELARDALETLK